jgi:hypothetical protein
MPPLSDAKRAELLEKLKTEGLRHDSFIVWEETNELIDGYHRVRICMELGIEITEANVIRRSFSTYQEVLDFMLCEQTARRELDDYSRIALTIDIYWDKYEEEAKNRMLSGKIDPLGKSGEGSSGWTANRIAAKADCGPDLVNQVKFLKEHADPTIIESIKLGHFSINGAYNDIMETLDRPPRAPRARRSKRHFNGEEKAKPVVRSLKAATKGLKVYMRDMARHQVVDCETGVAPITIATQDYLTEYDKWQQRFYPTGGFTLKKSTTDDVE